MCDSINIDVQLPAKQFDMAVHAWSDFRNDEGNWQKFEALHWVMAVLIAQWHAYSSARRVSACREDNGCQEDDPIIDLLG